MPRPEAQQTELVNGDSFLDIVSSVVGIMIIMVVLEGTRVKKEVVKLELPPPPVAADLERELAEEQSLRGDLWKTTAEIKRLEDQAAARQAERDLLATAVSAAEHEIAERRGKLGRAEQASFDTATQIAAARAELDQLEVQSRQAAQQPAETTVVENYPTPISRAVEGPEAHLLVANGRVIFVPLEPLLEEFKSRAQRQVHRLAEQAELTDAVGPIGGFRLRYTLERYDVPMDVARQTGRGGSYARLQKWTLIPTSNELGEPVRLALKADSDFRRELQKILPGRTTITIWVYPDGFDAFRQIRKELYRLNYSIAARPLPPGTPIAGSPDGSKSAAQ